MDIVKKEKVLLKIIKYFPTITIIISSVIITAYISSNYKDDFIRQKTEIREQYIQSNKDRIKININSITKLINNKSIQSNIALKDNLKSRINIAYKIAMNIYDKNKNKLSKKQIISQIKNSIETLRYDNGKEYFSIHTMEGINVLQPVRRELEGTSVINKQDIFGKYTVQNAIRIAKTQNEGFMTWSSYKATDKSKEFEKIGIVKKFEPYDLLITTACFVDEHDIRLKKEILNQLKVIDYQNNGYIFIVNNKRKLILTRINPQNLIKNNDNSFLEEYDNFVKSEKRDIYLEYTIKEENKNHLKLSYLKKMDIYGWVIGTGFDFNTLDVLIKNKQDKLETEHNKNLYTILITALIITIIFLILSIYVSHLIQNMFYQYKRKLIEEEASKFEKMLEELNLILDNLPMNVIFKDTKDNIIRANKNMAEAMGLKTDELINVPCRNIFPNDYQRYYKHDLEVIESRKAKTNIIETYPSKDGLRHIDFTNIPILNIKGEVTNIVVFVTDITEQKTIKEDNQRKETLLHQQSKMATMGEMIANIAHQWKQPLSTISMASTGAKLQKELDCLSDTQLMSALSSINTSAQYLAQTIDDFRNFFNPSKNITSKVNTSFCIEKSLTLLLPKFKTQNIEIIQDVQNIEIMSLENEIIQVLINILNNARDELIKYKQRRLIFINVYKNNNSLIIEILDNAGGIKEDIIDKIFDAYFTTKEDQEGTGIGLYMSKDILTKLLNASIEVENETFTYEKVQYTGAKFTINMNL